MDLHCSFSSEALRSRQNFEEIPLLPSSIPSILQGEDVPKMPNTVDSSLSLNLDHLKFLHHYCTSTFKTFTPEQETEEVWKSIVVEYALSYPFLMYELLALAASHLGHCKPEQYKICHTKSMELQTEALKGFNQAQKNVNEVNCGAILLFASLLSVHVLSDKSFIGSEPDEYLAHILSCINLMRSVQTVVVSEWWEHLKVSDLAPMLDVEPLEKPWPIPKECEKLSFLISDTAMDENQQQIYKFAIERLHWAFVRSNRTQEEHTVIRWVIAWPVLLKGEFVDLLVKHEPPALIILAFYGVLMHFYKNNWVVGESGKSLVAAVNARLGKEWRAWLEWPRQMVDLS